MATKASFNLADSNNNYDRIAYSFEVDVPVTDQWLLDVQSYFAEHLPVGVPWTGVYKFSLVVQEDREIDPNA